MRFDRKKVPVITPYKFICWKTICFYTYYECILLILGSELIQLMLWQNGRRLAYYSNTLSSVLKTRCARGQTKRSQWCNSINLLMKPSNCFPGILGPKCTLLLHINIADTIPGEPLYERKGKCYCNQFNTRKYFGITRRQKPVCHASTDNEHILDNLRKYASYFNIHRHLVSLYA